MRVMVIAKATEDSEKGAPPAEAFEAMDRFTEELVKAGVLVAGAGLKPSAQAKRIACGGPVRTVIDGPFAEAKELVAGFSIGRSGHGRGRGLGEALPRSMSGPSVIEIRPFFEAADLAEFLTPEELSTPRDGTQETRRRLIHKQGSYETASYFIAWIKKSAAKTAIPPMSMAIRTMQLAGAFSGRYSSEILAK